MRDQSDKSIDETGAALAVSIFLTKLLIFGGLVAIHDAGIPPRDLRLSHLARWREDFSGRFF